MRLHQVEKEVTSVYNHPLEVYVSLSNNEFMELCILRIKECAKENGGYLSSALYRQSKKKPTCSQIINTFGTWNAAVEQAGIMSKNDFKQLCKHAVRECFEKFPHSPSAELYDWYIQSQQYIDHPTSKQITRAFGRWDKVIKEFGLWEMILAAYSKEVCTEQIENCALANNGNVTAQLYEDYRRSVLNQDPKMPVPSYEVIIAIYGSWRNALKEINLTEIQRKLFLESIYREKQALEKFQRQQEIKNPYQT